MWRVQDLFPILITVRFPLIATVVGFGWFIVDSGLGRIKEVTKRPVIRLVLFLLFLMIVGVPLSLFRSLSLRFITNDYLRTVLMMVVIAAGARRFVDVERLLVVHLIGGAAFAFLMITRFQVGESGRLGDLGYYDANDLGMLVVSTLPMAVYLLRPGGGVKLWLRLFSLACMGLFIMTIIKTGSRGAFLGLIGIALYVTLRFTAIKSVVRFSAVGFGFVVLMALGSESYWTMMRTILNPSEDYNTTEETGRKAVWKRGMTYMVQHPLTGVGARCFPVAEGTLSPQAAMQDYGVGFKWSEAHNSFVQIGAELGVFGFVAFIAALFQAFRSNYQCGKRAPGTAAEQKKTKALAQALSACLIGYAVSGFFLSEAYTAFLYVLLGMVVALWKVTFPQGMKRRPSRQVAARRSTGQAAAPSPA